MTEPAESTEPAKPADLLTNAHDAHDAPEYALLGLLREGPTHGYRLAVAFAPDGRLGMILRLKMSQMYAYLRKLERAGWLRAWDEPTETHHMRHVFALTAEGERAFDAWLHEPVWATREIRLTFLLKLAFALEDAGLVEELVAGQRAATVAWLARLRAREASLTATEHTALQPQDTLRLLTLRHRIRLSEATLAWLDEVAAVFRSAMGKR
ncbi:MAG: PadR family transcriptional regulator [Ktedonobacterales bacterium]